MDEVYAVVVQCRQMAKELGATIAALREEVAKGAKIKAELEQLRSELAAARGDFPGPSQS